MSDEKETKSFKDLPDYYMHVPGDMTNDETFLKSILLKDYLDLRDKIKEKDLKIKELEQAAINSGNAAMKILKSRNEILNMCIRNPHCAICEKQEFESKEIEAINYGNSNFLLIPICKKCLRKFDINPIIQTKEKKA